MNPTNPLTPEQAAEITALAQSQRLIEAIKRYRELTNTSLAEAKAAVEALAAAPPKLGEEPRPPRALGQPTLEVEILDMLRQGKGAKIPAIKRYREATGSDLAAAKKAVEELGEKHGLSKKSNCFVATAVFEDEAAPEVMVLRDWRDTRLVRHWPGRVFIAAYGVIGPALAILPRHSARLRRCLKRVLARFAQFLARS